MNARKRESMNLRTGREDGAWGRAAPTARMRAAARKGQKNVPGNSYPGVGPSPVPPAGLSSFFLRTGSLNELCAVDGPGPIPGQVVCSVRSLRALSLTRGPGILFLNLRREGRGRR